MSDMPPDPFKDSDISDFLPMAQHSKKLLDAAIMAGMSDQQAMQWTLGIVTAMITSHMKK